MERFSGVKRRVERNGKGPWCVSDRACVVLFRNQETLPCKFVWRILSTQAPYRGAREPDFPSLSSSPEIAKPTPSFPSRSHHRRQAPPPPSPRRPRRHRHRRRHPRQPPPARPLPRLLLLAPASRLAFPRAPRRATPAAGALRRQSPRPPQPPPPAPLPVVRVPPSPPRAVVSDFFLGWTHRFARHRGVPRIVFSPSGAFGLSVAFALWRDLLRPDEESTVSFAKLSIYRRPPFAKLPLPRCSARAPLPTSAGSLTTSGRHRRCDQTPKAAVPAAIPSSARPSEPPAPPPPCCWVLLCLTPDRFAPLVSWFQYKQDQPCSRTGKTWWAGNRV
ncbi:formin-like protein 5 [Eucalyptus grandis]|uniref:formin-like protein 5 n=1 Tax=Eucalyptus grandis TaxID=71139 RepID=UPI00192EDFC9|nr:formin-like protein 5 [Eucalyptus grandis]